MEFSDASVTNAGTAPPASSPQSLSPTSSSSPPLNTTNASGSSGSSVAAAATNAAPVIISPCAACKILRRRCVEKCVLAPYFPPTDPAKFTIAHRVFGASNIIKLLQDLPEPQRADAVSSMVYEAGARIRDPVYGCAGAICQLQKQVSELQAQLAKSQADLLNAQTQQANLMALLCTEMANSQPTQPPAHLLADSFITSPQHNNFYQSNATSSLSFVDDNSLVAAGSFWEPLWT